MQIYYIIDHCGDGANATVRWAKTEEAALKFLEDNCEAYSMSDGCASELNLPDSTDLSTIGIDYWIEDDEEDEDNLEDEVE